MITRRDLLVATVAAAASLSIVSLAHTQAPLMRSSVFNWQTVEAKTTKTGARRDFFKSPTATLDELECHVTTLNPGEAPHAAHQHPDEELIIVKEGTMESTQNGSVKLAGPGSIIFEGSNELHGLRNVGKTQATYFVIKWISPGAKK